MEKLITIAFDHATDHSLQVDVEVELTADNAALIEGLNPQLTVAQVISILDAERIEHYEWERPRRIRR